MQAAVNSDEFSRVDGSHPRSVTGWTTIMYDDSQCNGTTGKFSNEKLRTFFILLSLNLSISGFFDVQLNKNSRSALANCN